MGLAPTIPFAQGAVLSLIVVVVGIFVAVDKDKRKREEKESEMSEGLKPQSPKRKVRPPGLEPGTH